MCYYATYFEIAFIPFKPAMTYWAHDAITGIHFVYNNFPLICCLNEIGTAVFVKAMDKVYSLSLPYDRVRRYSFDLARKSTTEVTTCTLVESSEYLG